MRYYAERSNERVVKREIFIRCHLGDVDNYMLEFLRPIVQYVLVIYSFLGLISLYFVRKIWLARRDRTRSIFSLERERASGEMANGFIGLLVIFGLMLGVYYLSKEVIPEIVPRTQETPTPILEPTIPPTPTIGILIKTPTTTPTPTPTILPVPLTEVTFTPVAAPQSTLSLPQGQPANCPKPGIKITRPNDGASVDGMVQIVGEAVVDSFDYYKFEFRIPGGSWSFAQRYNTPITSGALGSWNSDTVAPGTYEFRLVVVDTSGNYPAPCVIQLTVR
jgi:hypothetical protein